MRLGDLVGQPVADAAEADVPEGVLLAGAAALLAALGQRALGDHDDRRELPLEAALDPRDDLVDVEGPLRHQDHVRAAGQAGVQRDPAGVPAHDLDDQRAVVRLGGGVQPVDRLGRDGDRGVEAERVVGGAEVVVDRLGHADDADAVVGQPLRDAEGVLAADRDQRVDALLGEDLLDLVDTAVDLVRVGARGAAGSCRRGSGCPRRRSGRADGCRPSSGPCQPLRKPTNSQPCASMPLRTTARMTALRPGQSPPPVSTPTRMRILRLCSLEMTVTFRQGQRSC